MSIGLRGLALLAGGACLFGASSSHADDYPTRKFGAWTVSVSNDGKGCFVTRTYEGPGDTTLLLGLDTDASNRLTLLNANWSIKPKDQPRLTFRLSNASFPRHLAVGIAADGKQGFVTSFGETFPDTFAASKSLKIARGDIPVEDLALDGSGGAITELRKCVTALRDKPPVAKPRDGKNRIPLDPFAPDAARKKSDD